jgi:hypothetical protein
VPTSTDPAPAPWRLRLDGRELTVGTATDRGDASGTAVEIAVDGQAVTTRQATWTGPDLPLSELARDGD